MKRRTVLLGPLTFAALLAAQGPPSTDLRAQGPLIQVQEDFSQDPGWEAVNNRIRCQSCPTVVQDFGWRPKGHAGAARAGIGGRIWQSTTPAYYALPLGRALTFDDAFSASGRIAFGETGDRGAAYLGFFNSTRQEWRPWSSVAIRLVGESPERVGIHVDYMTAVWGGYGDETDIRLSTDRPHTWRISYDPDAVMAPWPDPRLPGYLMDERQTAEQIYQKARQVEPGATLEGVERRLRAALAEGLVRFFDRPPNAFWTLNKGYERTRGAITFQFDDGPPYKFFLLPIHRRQPIMLDRFGIFNFQVYHRSIEFYVSDLKVNGKEIDLSRDPGWEGRGNRTQFVEQDFQRQDFGYSETNWAGKQIGEIGGQFYRTEPIDPLHGYYADDVGGLTLDDPISFSGSLCFTRGGTDAGMFIGYFNAREKMATITEPRGGKFLNDSMGITIEGPTRVGYYFWAQCSPKQKLATARPGPVLLPKADRHTFRFDYDPGANGGVGRITVVLDKDSFTLDLTPQQRSADAVFDRFGLMNVRLGGKYVTVYFDDLTYTARRPPGYRRVRHAQKVVTAPYPPGGRQY